SLIKHGRSLALILLFTSSLLLKTAAAAADEEDNSQVAVPRTGAVTLHSDSNIWFNVILLAPILLAIIILDFAIFGAIADRSDNLNPVSKFFYHVRQGLSIVQSRQNKRYLNKRRYT
ncbi:Uncharacterized protein FKW44_007251, partial [Caligus rogercresseyi]